MAIEVNLPALGESVTSGTLFKWLVKVGDKVKAGQAIAEVETDKASMPIQSSGEGIVAKLDVSEGDEVTPGRRLLLLAQKGEAPAAVARDGMGSPTKERSAGCGSMDVEMKFAWIPPGSFLMGGPGDSSNPQHRVDLSKGFWMGIYPVTQAQFQAVMGYNPSAFPGRDRPVEMVSWSDAVEFCQKMAWLTGKAIRLPTEAEWEYACRAGTGTTYWSGSNERDLRKAGWCFSNLGDSTDTKPVGKLAANPWGLFDVHGNIHEFCQDVHGPIGPEKQTDPTGPPTGKSRVIRGGSYYDPHTVCTSFWRHAVIPGDRSHDRGFRVCFHPD